MPRTDAPVLVPLCKGGHSNVYLVPCADAREVADTCRFMQRYRVATIWLNLANGVEAAPWLADKVLRVCRIQSTSMEQRRWADALAQFPDEMLLRLMLGETQVIADFGTRKVCPRSFRQGVPIAERQLRRQMGLVVDERLSHFTRDGRTMRDSAEFTAAVDAACVGADRSRLRYLAKFCRPGRELGDIVCVCAPTECDNDYALHADLARIYL